MPARWTIMLSIARFRESVAEDFAVDVAGSMLTVRVKRHHASRRYRLRYDAVAGELKLTMPPRQRIAPARDWVVSQVQWIAGQIAARPGGGTVVGLGSYLPWRDGQLLIDWRAEASRAPTIDGDRLVLGGPQSSVGPRVKRWLQAHARAEFDMRTRDMAIREGLPLTSVAVGDPRSRWGSCSSGHVIRYSWRLAMAPDAVRHAIVAHEVAHLAHMNHGPDFHALADRLGGSANAVSRAWLKANGAALHALRFDPA